MFKSDLALARERLRPFIDAATTHTGWGPGPYGSARRLDPDRGWDYMAKSRELIGKSEAVLDIGTGGGERFAEVAGGRSVRAVATEAWVVNAPVAARRLGPLGIGVLWCDDEVLPLQDCSFDLVLNRHASFDVAEIARVLRPGATFCTEQVSRDHWRELQRYFPRATAGVGEILGGHLPELEPNGLEAVDFQSGAVPAAYADLGNVLYMLCITPWTIPGFDPLGSDLEALLDLERDLTTAEGIILTQGHELLEARKLT
jgi:SAM-dependent methyltransferase